ILAIKECCEACPLDVELTIKSDSRTMIDGLTTNLSRWEDEGFLTVADGRAIQTTVARLRERKADTYLQWVKGHSGETGNEAADRLADEGRQAELPTMINMHVTQELRLPGAKLQNMTQSLAYKIIKDKKMNTRACRKALKRRATKRNMDLAQGAAEDMNKETCAPQTIWKSFKNKDFDRKIRAFLWMSMHRGYKAGDYWSKFPDFDDWAICKECEITESMGHILTRCDAPGREKVWELASQLWRKKTGEDMEPTFGEILACGVIKKKSRGESRLYRILLSESAYLIWKLRCERVIGGKPGASDQEIENRWRWTINNRLEIDRLLTNTKWGKHTIQKSLVLQTWRNTLANEDRLPEDWTGKAGVLVGEG
ncbi:hypothetical protein DFH08DRAFT_708879, partial [Mycena albidolilacea]